MLWPIWGFRYIGVNPSTFYEARRNETVLRGWFIFDGPDYAKKIGAPITYEMILRTAAESESSNDNDNDDDGTAMQSPPPTAPITAELRRLMDFNEQGLTEKRRRGQSSTRATSAEATDDSG